MEKSPLLKKQEEIEIIFPQILSQVEFKHKVRVNDPRPRSLFNLAIVCEQKSISFHVKIE